MLLFPNSPDFESFSMCSRSGVATAKLVDLWWKPVAPSWMKEAEALLLSRRPSILEEPETIEVSRFTQQCMKRQNLGDNIRGK